MPKFYIHGGFDDSWSHVDAEIQADSVEAACEEFVSRVNDGDLPTTVDSYDPADTYVLEVDGGAIPVPGDFSHERSVLGNQAWSDLKLVLEVAGSLTEGEVEEILAGDDNLNNLRPDADFFGAIARLLAMVQGKRIEACKYCGAEPSEKHKNTCPLLGGFPTLPDGPLPDGWYQNLVVRGIHD